MSISNSSSKIPLDTNLDFISLALAQAPNDYVPENEIKYYCKKCEKIVDAITKEKPLQFICPICKKSGLAMGTESSLYKFYHLKQNI